MVTALGDVLLRQVPERLLAGVQTGEFKVYGSVVRSLSTGQIVGHLQETSGLANLAGNVLNGMGTLPVPGASTVLGAVGHTASFIQNEQIKAAIGVVESLQLANLGLSAVGIGVSVAGFAIIASKIAAVEGKIDAVGERLDLIVRGIDSLRRERLTDDFTHLRTLASQMDEAWLLENPQDQWQDVARQAHFLANRFERRVAELLDQGIAQLDLAEPFLEAQSIASATRVSARLAAGEDAAARAAAQESAVSLTSLGDRFSLATEARSRLSAQKLSPGSREWGDALRLIAESERPRIARMRAREAAAASTAITLLEIDRQEIRGRDWLEAARAEDGSPIVCLLPLAATA